MSTALPKKPGIRLVGFCLVAAGLFFLGAVIGNQGRLAVLGKRAEGEVVEITKTTRTSATTRRDGETREAYRERSRRKGTRYTLRVRFTPEGGTPTDFSTTSTFGHVLETGNAVKVIYLPGNPAGAEIDSARQLWLPMGVGFTVGTVCLAGGTFLIRRNRV